MKRLEYLTRHGSIAFVALRKVLWPFRYKHQVVDDPSLPPAWTSGVFSITVFLNKHYIGENASTCFRTFVVDHEVAHMAGKHGFWSLVTLLFAPFAWLTVRRYQERVADRYGARALTLHQMFHLAERLDKKTSWHRLLYGTPHQRAMRAKCLTP